MNLSSYFPCFILSFERVTPPRIGFAQLFIEDYDEKAWGKKYFLLSLSSTNTALIALTAIWRKTWLRSGFLCGPIKTRGFGVLSPPVSYNFLEAPFPLPETDTRRKQEDERGKARTEANDLPQSLNGIISNAMWWNFLTPCCPTPLWRTNRFQPDRLMLFVLSWELEP